MSFDSLALRLVTHELHDAILNGTIRHVEQLDSHSLVLKISQAAEIHHLLISTHAVHARTHLIQRPPKGQKRSHFADFLTKHIMRGRITGVEQIGWDRVLKLSIAPRSEDIEMSPKSIISEFMGKHSNIVLIDQATGKILECLRHIDETMSRYREVLPSVTYMSPPQQEKLDPLTLDRATFVSLIEDRAQIGWRLLFNAIDGLSPTLAKEIIARAGDSPTPDRLWEAYQQVVEHFHPRHSCPQLFIEAVSPTERIASPEAPLRHLNEADKLIAVSALKLDQFPNTESRPFETMSEALSAYYDVIGRNEAIQAERNTLNQILARMQTATDRKLVSLRQDLANAEQAEDYRIRGELLTANLYRTNRGQTVVEVENYYNPDPEQKIQIELDPKLSPSENAQQYFKRYTKAKRGRSIIHQLIADNEAEREALRYHASEVEEAQTLKELRTVRSTFAKKGWIREAKGQQKQKESEGTFRKYTSPDGFQLYVGRNSAENDLLLRRIASGRDMWLHAKQIHGSHVIIRNPENKPGIPMPTLLQAAQIAAAFSKARHASYVPVDYTWVKYVVKPKGSVAGFVNYTHQKTLYVEPKIPKAGDD